MGRRVPGLPREPWRPRGDGVGRPGKTYVGVAKELHLLNCAGAGTIAPGGELAFEMRVTVPRDAYGPETLYWNIAGPFPSVAASAPIEFLAPRR
jgi:hypothetical protein